MSILGKEAILEEIKKGTIKVEPFNEKMLGPASIDLHLSNAFRVFVALPDALNMTADLDFKAATKGLVIPEGGTLTVQPGQTVLGITQEKVTLGDGISGWLEGRSRCYRTRIPRHSIFRRF